MRDHILLINTHILSSSSARADVWVWVYWVGGCTHWGVAIVLVDFLSSVKRYNEEENEWETVVSMMNRRGGLGVGVLDGWLYAVGGYDGDSFL